MGTRVLLNIDTDVYGCGLDTRARAHIPLLRQLGAQSRSGRWQCGHLGPSLTRVACSSRRAGEAQVSRQHLPPQGRVWRTRDRLKDLQRLRLHHSPCRYLSVHTGPDKRSNTLGTSGGESNLPRRAIPNNVCREPAPQRCSLAPLPSEGACTETPPVVQEGGGR